jgi:hypothetical protein
MVVTSEHREVQHTTVLRYQYKNDAFCPIPTSSCVLAFIANNKGTFNPPALQSAFKRSLSLSLSLSLAYSLLRLRSSVLSLVSVVAFAHALRQSLTLYNHNVHKELCGCYPDYQCIGHCYEPSLQPCKRGMDTLVTVRTRPVCYRDNAPHDHAHTSLSSHRSRDHAIAILPSLSRHCHRSRKNTINPSHTSGVITPVATARLPIARSLVVSIYGIIGQYQRQFWYWL